MMIIVESSNTVVVQLKVLTHVLAGSCTITDLTVFKSHETLTLYKLRLHKFPAWYLAPGPDQSAHLSLYRPV